eukprot:403362475
MMALIDQNGLNTILSQESITLDSATDDTLIIAVSNESTGDFIFSRRFSGIIRPGLNLKRLQSIGVANGIWFAIHDSSSRAWLFWLQRDGISQQFYDTGLDFKFTGALVDNTLDRIIFSGFLQGMSNKIVLYAWSSALMLSQSEVYLTPNNDQIQIEHMVKNGQNLFGCVSSYYLSSSNLRHYGVFFNQAGSSNIGFYYSTENGNDKVYSCLGITYDSQSDTLITYVKALSSGIPYIKKIVISKYPTGVAGQDNVLKIAGDLLETQKTNTTYSNVIGGKLKFEIIPINQAFVCILNNQCSLNIAKVTLKGCKDQGKTFTFQQSSQLFINNQSKQWYLNDSE